MTKSGFTIRSYVQTSGSATTADGWIITGQSENSLFQQRLVNSYSSPSIRLAECGDDTVSLEFEYPMIEKHSATEDRCRSKNVRAAEAQAILNNLVLTLLLRHNRRAPQAQ